MASKSKAGTITISIKTDDIIGSEIMRNGDYKYARVGVKKNDDEYVSISYEWKGAQVPEFVLMLMQWVQANSDLDVETRKALEIEYDQFKKRLS